jgi:purine-nucleoside phosphorylase
MTMQTGPLDDPTAKFVTGDSADLVTDHAATGSATGPTANPLDDPAADPFEVATAAAAQIAARTGVEHHDIAMTLGSGWAKAADLIGETIATVPATEITGFGAPAVTGHPGTLRSVLLENGRHALVIGARTHYYEGHGVRRVVHSVRTAAATGARIMVLTNGAGGIKPHWASGTPVLISDHINLTADSPLEGATFVDLTDLYSARLRALAREVDPDLDEGVYVQFRGPQYETPAEVRMARTLGGHIVGMSTALEAIAARQSGMEVLGMSLITNSAAGIQEQPLSHSEVLAAGSAAEPVISALLAKIVARL